MVFNMKELNQVHELMSTCEAEILKQTGLKVRLTMVNVTLGEVSMEDMLTLIAESLGMKLSDYSDPCRKQKYTTLRCIGALFIRRYYPEMSYTQIGALFQQDHSSIIVSVRRGNTYLESNDNVFTTQYQKVEKSVLRLFNKK